jgi:hypothetical protein
LKCSVIDEDDWKTIFSETYKIDILPHDQMIWKIESASGSAITHNICPFIAAWVAPVDQKWHLDSVRAWAIKYHPKESFFYQWGKNGPEELKIIVECVYKYLNHDVGIKYVNQPFNSVNVDHSQRVLLPSRVIENKVWNCIDLTVAFASILEWLGIYSLIFITPTHAFIGWWNQSKIDDMLFLETTSLGRYTFEEAIDIGRDQFNQHFVTEWFLWIAPNSLLQQMKGCQIVDLNEVRKSGIYSIS